MGTPRGTIPWNAGTGRGWTDKRGYRWIYVEEHRKRRAKASKIVAVIMHTSRDAEGIHYEVNVVTEHSRKGAYERGEDEIGIWDLYVAFGSDAAHHAGGFAFKAAAQAQETRANDAWKEGER